MSVPLSIFSTSPFIYPSTERMWDVFSCSIGPSNRFQFYGRQQLMIRNIRARLHEGERDEKLIDCLSIRLSVEELTLYHGHLRTHLEDQVYTDIQRLQRLEERMFALEAERISRAQIQARSDLLRVVLLLHSTVHGFESHKNPPRFLITLEGEYTDVR